jgi:hypothetical protein
LALAGDPAALRLCLKRIVGPYPEGAVEFVMPPIRNAANLASAIVAMVDTLVQAIDTRDFDRRLEIESRRDAAGIGPGGRFNFQERFCCGFAAGAANEKSSVQVPIAASGRRMRGRRLDLRLPPPATEGDVKGGRFNGKIVIPGRPARAGPGNHEHRLINPSSDASVPGFRARGRSPRPGMTR